MNNWGFTLDNVTASWSENGKNILEGVTFTFDIRDASTAALPLMGPSGQGKSTLLYLLAALKLPSAGTVTWHFHDDPKPYVFGQSLRPKDIVQLRRHRFGFAFQSSTLSKHLTVIENIAYPLLLQGIKWEQALEAAKTTFKDVLLPSERQNEKNLMDLMESFPSQLSGGQRQRAALAQAIIHNPCVLFADEPTGQLDVKTRKQVMGVLKQWVEKGQGERCLIWVTHHNMGDLKLMDVNDFFFIEEKKCVRRDRTWLENWIDDYEGGQA
jgi:putative ABC transport system ATP-binding protein